MTTKEITRIMAEEGPEAASAAYRDLREKVGLAKTGAEAAVSAYYADLKEGKAKVAERIEALKQQYDGTFSQVDEMQQDLVAATMDGDDATVLRVQDAMSAIEARRSAIQSQIDMLTNAKIPESKELYQAVTDASSSLEDVIAVSKDVEKTMLEYANEQINAWNTMRCDAGYYDGPTRVWAARIPDPYQGIRDKVNKVVEHYQKIR